MRLADEATSGAWQSIHFRVLCESFSEPLEVDSPRTAYLAYFEGDPQAHEPGITMRLPKMPLIGGHLLPYEFAHILRAWSTDEPAALLGYLIAAPKDNHAAYYGEGRRPDLRGLDYLSHLPESEVEPLENVLLSSGHHVTTDEHNMLWDRIYRMRRDHDIQSWLREFMHLDERDFAQSRVVVRMPLPIFIQTAYDKTTSLLAIRVRCRPPWSPDRLELRTDPWNPHEQALTVVRSSTDSAGWTTSEYETPVVQATTKTVWITRLGTEHDFDWQLEIDFDDFNQAVARRRWFLTQWYQGDHSLEWALAPRELRPRKGQAQQADLEVALANVLAALGCRVFTGGVRLSTPGYDLIAFDDSTKAAYVVSVTTANNMAEKLRTLMRVQRDVIQQLDPVWTPRFCIVTTDREELIRDDDQTAAMSQGVHILAAEDLACLRGESPDLDAFHCALHKVPMLVDPGGLLVADATVLQQIRPVRRLRSR